jgi:hypothetical protein
VSSGWHEKCEQGRGLDVNLIDLDVGNVTARGRLIDVSRLWVLNALHEGKGLAMTQAKNQPIQVHAQHRRTIVDRVGDPVDADWEAG